MGNYMFEQSINNIYNKILNPKIIANNDYTIKKEKDAIVVDINTSKLIDFENLVKDYPKNSRIIVNANSDINISLDTRYNIYFIIANNNKVKIKTGKQTIMPTGLNIQEASDLDIKLKYKDTGSIAIAKCNNIKIEGSKNIHNNITIYDSNIDYIDIPSTSNRVKILNSDIKNSTITSGELKIENCNILNIKANTVSIDIKNNSVIKGNIEVKGILYIHNSVIVNGNITSDKSIWYVDTKIKNLKSSTFDYIYMHGCNALDIDLDTSNEITISNINIKNLKIKTKILICNENKYEKINILNAEGKVLKIEDKNNLLEERIKQILLK